MDWLQGITIVNLAVNLPGPAAARRLGWMGATVVKVEPPTGDPMERYCADWYRELTAGQELVRLDLKTPGGRARLDELLRKADLLVTSNRPATLQRLQLCWADLHQKHPRLCQVAIVGFPAPRENAPGHDLTYQAACGLLHPPHLPRALAADLAGAEQAVGTALGLLLARERLQQSGYAQVALSEAAAAMAEPLRFHLTVPGALLGGGVPEYNIYQTQDDWIAVAALEPYFQERLEEALGDDVRTVEQYRAAFHTRTAAQWQEVGQDIGVPITRIDTV